MQFFITTNAKTNQTIQLATGNSVVDALMLAPMDRFADRPELRISSGSPIEGPATQVRCLDGLHWNGAKPAICKPTATPVVKPTTVKRWPVTERWTITSESSGITVEFLDRPGTLAAEQPRQEEHQQLVRQADRQEAQRQATFWNEAYRGYRTFGGHRAQPQAYPVFSTSI